MVAVILISAAGGYGWWGLLRPVLADLPHVPEWDLARILTAYIFFTSWVLLIHWAKIRFLPDLFPPDDTSDVPDLPVPPRLVDPHQAANATLTATPMAAGWVWRDLLLAHGEQVWIVRYDGTHWTERVRVNGRTVATVRPRRLRDYFRILQPRIEFVVGGHAAVIEVAAWPWFTIRRFRLSVQGKVVYEEGR